MSESKGTARVIGTDRIVQRISLTKAEREAKREEHERTFRDQRSVEANYQDFEKFAQPRIRRALDPDYSAEDLEGEKAWSLEAAHRLQADLKARRALKGATVAELKARRRVLFDAVVLGYTYEVADCEMVADDDKLEVAYISKRTGAEVDRRAMTSAERQRSLELGDEPKKKSKSGAPATAH